MIPDAPAGGDDIDRVDEGNPDPDIDLEPGEQPPGGTGGAGGSPADGASGAGGVTSEPPPVNVFAEDTGADCAIGALPDGANLPTLSTLPDPFLGLDGQRLTSRDQWRCRRAELKALGERFIYGPKPGKPESVSGAVTTTSISVDVQNQGVSARFTATISLPAGATGPVPAVIGYGGSAFQNAILQEGVAFIDYDVDAVGDETTNNPKRGAFYTANPQRQDTGMLVAWAWGVSRMLDVLESSGSQIIDPRAVGVLGCSRSGKGAFIAGAFDERIALTIPFESGMAGVAAFRLVVPEGGEVLRNAIQYRPWAGNAYTQFLQLTAGGNDPAGQARDNVASGQLQSRLPIDTHEVIGMIAPRGLLVLGNPGIVNLAPNAELVSVLAGAEIYAALGAAQNISYTSNTQNGNHCALRQEYVPLLQQNLRKFLKHDASATTGTLDVDPRLTGQLGPNVAWQAPTLE